MNCVEAVARAGRETGRAGHPPGAAAAGSSTFLPVTDYDLAATLEGGQAFRWSACAEPPAAVRSWEGVVAGRWIRLTAVPGGIWAEAALPQRDWRWLTDYLGADENLGAVLATFPDDAPMREATAACRGLRLLRQEPWECLASFVLSSTKQIVQIREMVRLLCERFGDPVVVPPGRPPAFAFPDPDRLAAAGEAELRACKLGFRAPYLRAVAQRVAQQDPDLARLRDRPLAEARAALLALPGVGPKIANCVLLFSLGFRQAFPLDVWVLRALRQLYFPRRRVTFRRLEAFSATHFGPHGGYAQQYLFHHIRQRAGRDARRARVRNSDIQA
ncbi:MAG: hypothetical protein IPM17_11715 [Verrucomicrobia bacterium]|nr:hypothetical protein [Verrucomicrobiota bacterium]